MDLSVFRPVLNGLEGAQIQRRSTAGRLPLLRRHAAVALLHRRVERRELDHRLVDERADDRDLVVLQLLPALTLAGDHGLADERGNVE